MPDFFLHPRVVVAVAADPAPGHGPARPLTRSRLYLGYQEASASIEIISYNEQAGRFEFQVVTDYRADATPQVSYAQRSVCVVCHQNHGPIFSRATWDETNANPIIAERLAAVREAFYGVPVRRGIDVPGAIDEAVAEGADLALLQWAWREACEAVSRPGAAAHCRALGLLAALQFRLTGQRPPGEADPTRRGLLAALVPTWEGRWKDGVAIPDSSLPNRSPLGAREPGAHGESTGPPGAAAAVAPLIIDAADMVLEPALPRGPREVWRAADLAAGLVDRIVAGWGGFFHTGDMRGLDARLAELHPDSAAETAHFDLDCEMRLEPPVQAKVLTFECRGAGASVSGWTDWAAGKPSGGVSVIALPGGETAANLKASRVTYGTGGAGPSLRVELRERAAGLHARLSNGNRLAPLRLTWRAQPAEASAWRGRATVIEHGDFQALRRAVEALERETADGGGSPLDGRPLRRDLVLDGLRRRLGAPPVRWCCASSARLPPARVIGG